MKINRLKNELAKAKEKAAEWQARVRDLKKQITEQENLEILQVVRGMAVSPEELRGLLDMIRMVKPPQNGASATLENNNFSGSQ